MAETVLENLNYRPGTYRCWTVHPYLFETQIFGKPPFSDDPDTWFLYEEGKHPLGFMGPRVNNQDAVSLWVLEEDLEGTASAAHAAMAGFHSIEPWVHVHSTPLQIGEEGVATSPNRPKGDYEKTPWEGRVDFAAVTPDVVEAIRKTPNPVVEWLNRAA